jgi:hypothetical protein
MSAAEASTVKCILFFMAVSRRHWGSFEPVGRICAA